MPQADFRDIECWVFDLDNTLYPPSVGLFGQIDRLWNRIWIGGGVCVYRTGPKDALVEVVRWPSGRSKVKPTLAPTASVLPSRPSKSTAR